MCQCLYQVLHPHLGLIIKEISRSPPLDGELLQCLTSRGMGLAHQIGFTMKSHYSKQSHARDRWIPWFTLNGGAKKKLMRVLRSTKEIKIIIILLINRDIIMGLKKDGARRSANLMKRAHLIDALLRPKRLQHNSKRCLLRIKEALNRNINKTERTVVPGMLTFNKTPSLYMKNLTLNMPAEMNSL